MRSCFKIKYIRKETASKLSLLKSKTLKGDAKGGMKGDRVQQDEFGTPSGSKFSILHTVMALSCASRTTSYSTYNIEEIMRTHEHRYHRGKSVEIKM